MTDFLTDIPETIKPKVIDKDWSQVFKFETMPCNHDLADPEFKKVDCDKCKFDDRELWLENTLTKQSPTEKQTDPETGLTKTLSKIVVTRGKFDDCIGIERHYT